MTHDDVNWRRWENQLSPDRPEADTVRAAVHEFAAVLRRTLELLRLAAGLAVMPAKDRARLQLAPARQRNTEETRDA